MGTPALLRWCVLLRCCSTMLQLAGKQLLSYACLKQDRPVLVMCFYCFMIEEEVWDLFLVKFQATGLKTLSSTTKVLLCKQVLRAKKTIIFPVCSSPQNSRSFIMLLLHVDDRLPSLLSSPPHHISSSSNQKHSNQPYKVPSARVSPTLGIPVTPTPGNTSPRPVSGAQALCVV